MFNDVMQIAGTVLFVTFCLTGMASLLFSLVNMFRTVANRKEGVPLFPRPFFSPWMLIYQPSLLTERGLAARRSVFYGVAIFIVCWFAALIVGLATGVAHYRETLSARDVQRLVERGQIKRS